MDSTVHYKKHEWDEENPPPAPPKRGVDPYEKIYKELAELDRKRKRLFWSVLTVTIIICIWLIYKINQSGGFGGLF